MKHHSVSDIVSPLDYPTALGAVTGVLMVLWLTTLTVLIGTCVVLRRGCKQRCVLPPNGMQCALPGVQGYLRISNTNS